MLLFLLFIATTTPGNGGIDLPPADDQVGRWIATSVAVLAVIGPLVAAKIQAKKNPSNGPAPSPSESATPRLDVGQAYLERYVQGLEDRVKTTEAENRELHRQVTTLIEDRATFRAQNEALRADIAELRDEVHELRGQLRGRS